MTTLTELAQKKKQDARTAFIDAAWADDAPDHLAELARNAEMDLADADGLIARVAEAKGHIQVASEVLRLRRVASKAKAHSDATHAQAEAAIEKLESEAEAAAQEADSARRELNAAESAARRVLAMYDEGFLPASRLPNDVVALIERREQEDRATKAHSTMIAAINDRNRVRDDVERIERKLRRLPVSRDHKEQEALVKEELERAKANLAAAETRLSDAERAHATARKGL
ncbi:MAG: hypothetical protein HBSAPP03_25900 [Phycisphaerae bacterium]|nr:MAG: hypothetical protein HBSAPP03_25900 [Phycisphaerae bacterium]